MLDLSEYHAFEEIDQLDMYGHIRQLPDQLEGAFRQGMQMSLGHISKPKAVVIAGMGGSAIGADLLAAYISDECPLPVVVWRDYDLPAWANGRDVLVIVSSHSGNTEESLSAFEAAVAQGCQVMTISTGGKLSQRANQVGAPAWLFDHSGAPRSAVGHSFGLLAACFSRLGLAQVSEQDIASAANAMRAQEGEIKKENQPSHNPAKRLAGQLIGRWVMVVASGFLVPVARRWKCQISEVAKAWGQFEFLPEMDHNTLAGICNPAPLFSNLMVLFLESQFEHDRNRIRAELTRELMMVEGIGTDAFRASGDSRLEQLWTALHFGDYTSYYLAMAYRVDPTAIPTIDQLKASMRDE
ncbi:MAG: bifunctional phosphoglucose/phosphomannose isomerase [Anaerolineae bacterium]|nr:bifunctional phosphoglucose/phosphomannose isomerase [Anaerolineae bacterium]